MKVLFVTGEFPPMQGGVGDYTREIGLALANLRCDVHVVTSTQARAVDGITVHSVIRNWDWSCWRILLDLVQRHQPDVVHVQYQAAAYGMHPAINFWPWRLGLLGVNRPCSVVTFHDLRVPYLFPKAGRLRRWVVEQLARHSDAIITTNREDYRALKKLNPPPTLIPIGSNLTLNPPADYNRAAWRAQWGVGPDDFLLCFFGFINNRKGVDTLIRALYLLTREPEAPRNPQLLFIGGQTGASDPTNVAYLATIQALIAELGLQDRIHWTGYISNEKVSASFLAADLCVLPFREGVSLLHGTLHAALVHGVPILCTQPRVPLPELESGENIYLVPPEDAQALAAAIRHLASSPDERHKLGAGAKTLSHQFQWDSIASDTLKLYRSLASGR
jgi:glycosyltransferase involved in cell wall biosynthesis